MVVVVVVVVIVIVIVVDAPENLVRNLLTFMGKVSQHFEPISDCDSRNGLGGDGAATPWIDADDDTLSFASCDSL